MNRIEREQEADGVTGWSGKQSLLGCTLLIGVVWLWVFPAIGRVPAVRADIDRVDAAGIDASALYWTELNDSRLWAKNTLHASHDRVDLDVDPPKGTDR